MKVLIIPDIHQIPTGIEYARSHLDEVDKVVFLGDIVDNWESEEWWDTFDKNPINVINKLGQFKRENPEKVHWLLGNHDLSYLALNRYDQQVSGHQWKHHEAIQGALRNFIKEIDIAVKLDNWVFSHAGFSEIWFKNRKEIFLDLSKQNLIERCNKDIKDSIETLCETDHIIFHHLSMSGSGDHPSEGPLWIRPNSLALFPLFTKQVIGHTECGPMLISTKDGEKIKSKIFISDTRNHNCFTLLDTKTDEFILSNNYTLDSREFSWEDIKNSRNAYRISEKEKAKFFRNYFG